MPETDDIAASGKTAGQAESATDLIDAAISVSGRGEPDAFSVAALGSPADGWPALFRWLFRRGYTRRRVLDELDRVIAELDRELNAQINVILHDARFQALEASWRGLRSLVASAHGQPEIKIRVLNLAWSELARDLERAIEFDQSQFFGKIYSDEFGSPGGEPFGAILGDYAFSHRSSSDMETLESLSRVAAAAFAPMVMGTHPSMFGLDDWAELGPLIDLPRVFQHADYIKWRAFRETEDARFIGLMLPRVLMREPYGDAMSRVDSFRFEEDVAGPGSSRYLWGNGVYAFGTVLVRAFAESGWLASIQGVERGIESGGLVTGLPQHDFATDSPGIASKYSTEVLITDTDEKTLGDLGFMPICQCKDTPWSAFYGSASAQRPKVFDELGATVNARLSSMLQYMFCVSRFAHYLKVIGRDRVGSFATAQELQRTLQRWLINYSIDDDEATVQAKAKAPLREGRVEVREAPGKPGHYFCVMHLRPHFQLDQVVTAVKLVTDINSVD